VGAGVLIEQFSSDFLPVRFFDLDIQNAFTDQTRAATLRASATGYAIEKRNFVVG
jgi:hypothetical protein